MNDKLLDFRCTNCGQITTYPKDVDPDNPGCNDSLFCVNCGSTEFTLVSDD